MAPTILADVDNAMRVAREEIFGPVLCLIPYDDDDDAVRIANDSALRPGRRRVVGRPRRAVSVARRLRTGSVSVNGNGGRRSRSSPSVGSSSRASVASSVPEGLPSFLEPRSIGLPPSIAG